MKRDAAFWRKMYFELAQEVEQTLGKALGYPWYEDDQKNFPGATEKDGVCVGEHVPESILAEAARKLDQKMFLPTYCSVDFSIFFWGAYERRKGPGERRVYVTPVMLMTKFRRIGKFDRRKPVKGLKITEQDNISCDRDNQ